MVEDAFTGRVGEAGRSGSVEWAIAWLSERTFDRGAIQLIDVPSLFGIAFVAGLAGTVFAVGDRLQRDTEGLV